VHILEKLKVLSVLFLGPHGSHLHNTDLCLILFRVALIDRHRSVLAGFERMSRIQRGECCSAPIASSSTFLCFVGDQLVI
jgi:hypothetical protein